MCSDIFNDSLLLSLMVKEDVDDSLVVWRLFFTTRCVKIMSLLRRASVQFAKLMFIRSGCRQHRYVVLR